MWFPFRLLLVASRLLGRRQRDLVLENLALRHQLAVYQRSPRRPALDVNDRRFWSTLALGWSGWHDAITVVQPETVIRWHRSAWRRYWTWKSRGRGPGRPPVPREVQALIVQMAQENRTWGAVRIVGELRALGLEVSASTVRSYRRRALCRPPSASWRTFLRLHDPEIWAADFFAVQSLTFRTFYVFVLLDHERRRIVHWNVTPHSTAPWVWRPLIEATP
jgi:putative transposase